MWCMIADGTYLCAYQRPHRNLTWHLGPSKVYLRIMTLHSKYAVQYFKASLGNAYVALHPLGAQLDSPGGLEA